MKYYVDDDKVIGHAYRRTEDTLERMNLKNGKWRKVNSEKIYFDDFVSKGKFFKEITLEEAALLI